MRKKITLFLAAIVGFAGFGYGVAAMQTHFSNQPAEIVKTSPVSNTDSSSAPTNQPVKTTTQPPSKPVTKSASTSPTPSYIPPTAVKPYVVTPYTSPAPSVPVCDQTAAEQIKTMYQNKISVLTGQYNATLNALKAKLDGGGYGSSTQYLFDTIALHNEYVSQSNSIVATETSALKAIHC